MIKCICLIYGISEESRCLNMVYIKNFKIKKMSISFTEYFSEVRKGYIEDRFNGKFVFNTLERVENGV